MQLFIIILYPNNQNSPSGQNELNLVDENTIVAIILYQKIHINIIDIQNCNPYTKIFELRSNSM